MIQLIKYLVAFCLGSLFMAYNPEFNQHVINTSDMLKNKAIEITGKKVPPSEPSKKEEQK